MGRLPKPTALKILQGNAGKRPLNENEPKFDAFALDEIPKAPSYLYGQGKKEWNRIAPMLSRTKVLTFGDINILGAYCQAFQRWVDAEKIIKKEGYTIITDKGNIIQRPEVGIANTSMKLMKDCAREFGLTPSSRSQLKITPPHENETDEFMKFITR